MRRNLRVITASMMAASLCCSLLGHEVSAQLQPRKVIAVGDGTQNFGTTRRAVSFYDVTTLPATGGLFQSGGTASDGEDYRAYSTPLFSIWTGYEDSTAAVSSPKEGTGNFEEIAALTVNPANGNVYMLAFDSGPKNGGSVDSVGDTEGVYDLYRMDYQKVLALWEADPRDPTISVHDDASAGKLGQMYAPRFGSDYADTDAVPGPSTGDRGYEIHHPDHNIFQNPLGSPPFNFPETTAAEDLKTNGNQPFTIFVDEGISKIGEVSRADDSDDFPPGSQQTISFRDAETLIVVTGINTGADAPENDKEIRVVSRVSTDPGLAQTPSSKTGASLNRDGGFNSVGNTQSWESTLLGLVNLDFDTSGNPVGRSEVQDVVYVNRDGVEGIWIGERDGGGDDIAFFQIVDFDAAADASGSPTGGNGYSTIDSLGSARALDADPELDPTTNDGYLDFLITDANGNLVIGESGFFRDPAEEPAVLRLNIDQYQSGNIVTTAGDVWDDLDAIDGLGPVGSDRPGDFNDPPARLNELVNAFAGGTGFSLTDDAGPIDGRFIAFDKGAGHLYYFDIDGGSLPDVVTDVYVIDINTGEIIYEELNGINMFLKRHAISFFLRGDIDDDGVISTLDIDALADAWKGTDDLLKEQFDLTGDDTSTKDDVDELIEVILGTAYGDVNLDGKVDDTDLAVIQANLGSAGGYGDGSVSLSGTVDLYSAYLLFQNYGFDATSTSTSVSSIPEPASLSLLALGGMALLRRRR